MKPSKGAAVVTGAANGIGHTIDADGGQVRI